LAIANGRHRSQRQTFSAIDLYQGAARPTVDPCKKEWSRQEEAMGNKAVGANASCEDPAESGDKAALEGRIRRIGLAPKNLTPERREILDQIRVSCPACKDPELCKTELAAAPARGWEDWDEYCPNADKLRVLAALSQYPDDGDKR
jgi:hypothetical protein